MCTNGSIQQAYILRKEVTSPTTASKVIITTGEERCNEVRHTKCICETRYCIGRIQDYHEDKRIIIWYNSWIFPVVYKKYVLYKGKQTIIYIRMLKSLYRMHFYSIFYYKQFRKDVEAIGFEVNPYSTCVANRMKYYIQKQSPGMSMIWNLAMWIPK